MLGTVACQVKGFHDDLSSGLDRYLVFPPGIVHRRYCFALRQRFTLLVQNGDKDFCHLHIIGGIRANSPHLAPNPFPLFYHITPRIEHRHILLCDHHIAMRMDLDKDSFVPPLASFSQLPVLAKETHNLGIPNDIWQEDTG